MLNSPIAKNSLAIALSLAICSTTANSTEPDSKSLADLIVKSVLELAKVNELRLDPCGDAPEREVPSYTEYLHKEITIASRAGAKKIAVTDFDQARVERRIEDLDYWLSKVRQSGGKTVKKDVTPTQGTSGGSILDWIIGSVGQRLVDGAVTAVSQAGSTIYGVTSDEYLSAGIARYNATLEYTRGISDTSGNGYIKQVVFECR